jgi:mRNA degradation ribonuclease J1/J2
VLKGGAHLYSMWDGYWDDMPRTQAFIKANKLKNAAIHCSGHAYRQDLARLLHAAAPRMAVPMHTEGKLRHGFKRIYGSVLLARKGEWQKVGE